MLRPFTAVLCVCILVPGCRADSIIIDDFGTSGYAVLTGTVVRYPADPYRSGELYVSCGPGGFARTAQTDASGSFNIELSAPGPFLPELQRLDWLIPCLVRAGTPGFVSDTVDVKFSPDQGSAVTTQLTLQEPAP